MRSATISSSSEVGCLPCDMQSTTSFKNRGFTDTVIVVTFSPTRADMGAPEDSAIIKGRQRDGTPLKRPGWSKAALRNGLLGPFSVFARLIHLVTDLAEPPKSQGSIFNGLHLRTTSNSAA